MLRRLATAAAVLATAAGVGALTASTASAHTVQTLGAYTLAIGWQHEPAYAGQLNAVQVFVKDSHGDPITNLNAGDMKVQVSSSGVTSTAFDLEPAFDEDTGIGNPGEYDATLIPTAAGNYTFLLSGAVRGTPAQGSFTSGPTTFAPVTDATPIEFPASAPSTSELATRITRDATRLQQALDDARTASDSASRATVIAIVALVAGLLLGGGGIAAAMLARRRTPRA